MAGEADRAEEVLDTLQPIAEAGVGMVAPAAAPLVPAVLEAIKRAVREAEIAVARGEVQTGQQLLALMAERLAAAAADPGLPPEATG